MTIRSLRISHLFLVAAAFAVCLAAGSGIYQLAYADGYSSTQIATADPYRPLFLESPTMESAPAEPDVSRAVELWRNGQIPQALIIVVFIGATFASRKIPWLQEGKRALYVTAFLTAASMLAEAASRGTTPNLSMILSALMAAVGLLINGNAPNHAANGVPVARALKTPSGIE